MTSLILVEDHALVREGLVQTLRTLGEGVMVDEAADCESANRLLEESSSYDLMILDLGLPGIDGLSFLSLIRRRCPGMPVIILSAYDDAHTVQLAMQSGAAGFVPKSYSSEQLLEVVREVLAGGVFAPHEISRVGRALQPSIPARRSVESADFGLTERQSEVLRLMASGKSNRDIAALLGLSEGTVKIHLTAIFKALGVSSRTQAIVAVARQGVRL
jgi:DNA-binding NarL/FixJ family response regulator